MRNVSHITNKKCLGVCKPEEAVLLRTLARFCRQVYTNMHLSAEAGRCVCAAGGKMPRERSCWGRSGCA